MKKLLLLLPLFITISAQAQGLITLLHNGQSSFFSSIQLDFAYAAAQNGDTLLLPGEAIGLSANGWIIDKPIHIIGVGHQPDSLGGVRATFLGGDIFLLNSSNGSSIENLHVSGGVIFGTSSSNQEVANCFFLRCLFGGIVELGDYGTNDNYVGNNIFMECIFADQTTSTSSLGTACINGFESRGNRFINCIVERGMANLGPGTLFDHCLFIGYGDDLLDYDIEGCYFSNSIFFDFDIGSSPSSIRNNTFVNNLVATTFSPPAQNILGANYVNVSQIGLFVNKAQPKFSYADDYHLANPSAYTGNDGTPVGIFGGSNGFKWSTTPRGPQLLQKIIDIRTDSLGRLPVRIRVKAQDY